MSQKSSDSRDILISYLNLRAALGLSAIALPILVWGIGLMNGVQIKTSISAYYHLPPTRDIFVAILCAIGVFLFTYKGYSDETWLNRALGVAAIGVGMCPTGYKGMSSDLYTSILAILHNICAFVLFSGMALLVSYSFPKNQSKSSKLPLGQQKTNSFLYRLCGLVIIGFGGFYLIRALWYWLNRQKLPSDPTLFYVEFASILAFGFAWLFKSHLIYRLITRKDPR
jgi:hypothetical protein